MEHHHIHIIRDPFHSGRCPACSGIRNQGDAQRIQLMTFSFAVVHRIPYENEVRRWNLCVFLSFRLTFVLFLLFLFFVFVVFLFVLFVLLFLFLFGCFGFCICFIFRDSPLMH